MDVEIQKGVVLALNATNEQLAKMNEYLLRKEEEEDEKEKMEEDELQKSAELLKQEDLVKAVVSQVMKQLVDLNGDKDVKVSGTKWPMNGNPAGEDQEEKVDPRSKTEEVQKPISAMLKADEDKKKGADEHPMEEEEAEYKKGDMPVMVKQLMKSLKAAEDKITALEADLPKKIEAESEKRLRKMGFREESGLKGVQRTQIGLQDTPIVKSEETITDVTELLKDLSYKQLRDMQLKMQNGQTDGLPRELVGG